MEHDFILVNADTDSISVCKKDQSLFTKEEQQYLLKELNSLFPEKIKFEPDGVFKKVLILKAKNYVLQDESGKIKTKGSAIRDTKRQPALREFIQLVISRLLNGEQEKILQDYYSVVKEIHNVQDINRWAKKLTITSKTLNPERTNEQKAYDAIQGTDLREGDKAFFYFAEDDSLKLIDQWNGDHSKGRLLKSLHDTIKIFENVLDVKQYTNFALKRSQKLLPEILNG